MKSKSTRRLLLVILILTGIVAVYVYREFNRTNRDLANDKPEFTIAADTILKQFSTNEHNANTTYLGKVIQITGPVKSIDKDSKGFVTCVLGSDASASVRCLVDSMHTSDVNFPTLPASLTIRGVCTGYTPDEIGLGADLILNRCVILSTK